MATLTARNKIFTDLDLDFIAHPNTRKVLPLKDDKAIVRSLKNLILTNHYERPFHPEIGCDIRRSLFDNIMPSTAMTIQNTIFEVIENFILSKYITENCVDSLPVPVVVGIANKGTTL